MQDVEVVGIFDPDFTLTHYKFDDNIIYAQEVLGDGGEEKIVRLWENNPWLDKETNVCKYWIKDKSLQNKYDMLRT